MSESYTWEHVGLALDQVAAECASEDKDLRASSEIKILGYTDTVNDTRADILEDYPDGQLQLEIREKYRLDEFGYELARVLVANRIRRQNNIGTP